MEAADDIMEQILIRSDVEDVIRCKSVCKSWYSFISTPYFADSHLKQHASNNINPDKRIITDFYGLNNESDMLNFNRFFIIGSANGLVCVCPKDFELLVVNPCTRQTMEILEPPPEPLPKSTQRWHLIWGFGYDSSNNDYKIVLGLVMQRKTTRFYVFSLKTCVWKFIQEFDYVHTNWNRVSGLLCDGVLHWFMLNLQNKEQIILSFNLSHEEFTETRQPDPDDHPSYEYGCSYTLGVLEECLCIYELDAELPPTPTKIWVLRSYKSGKQSWVELPLNYVMNHGVAYHMNKDDYSYDDDTPHLSNSGEYIGAPIFVPSLLSPRVNMDSSSKSGSNGVVILVEEKAAGMANTNALIRNPNILADSGQYIGVPIFVPGLISPHVNMDFSSKSGSNDVVISVEEKAAGMANKNALIRTRYALSTRPTGELQVPGKSKRSRR